MPQLFCFILTGAALAWFLAACPFISVAGEMGGGAIKTWGEVIALAKLPGVTDLGQGARLSRLLFATVALPVMPRDTRPI